MITRVFWMHTDGGEPDDGAWYWTETDLDTGESVGEPTGPFESPVAAVANARKAIVRAARARDAVNDAVARVVARIEMYDESEAASGTGAMHLDALIKHCRALKRAVDAYTAVILPSADQRTSQE